MTTATPGTPPPTPYWVAALAGLLLAVAAAYWSGLGGGFALDDTRNIVLNPAVKVPPDAGLQQWRAAAFSSPVDELPRPLAMLSFAANHAATGLDPRPMKLTNLAIHLLNVLLVFACVRALLALLPAGMRGGGARVRWVALAVAALWALHPINLMAVLYVVQRMESLAHTFVFAGLWLYLHGRARQQAGAGGWGAIVVGLVGGSALGLLAKESAVLLPLYALLAEWLVLQWRGAAGRQPGLRRLYAIVLVLPGVVGGIFLLRRFAHAGAYAGREFGLVERLLTEARAVLDYLHWSVLPSLSKLSLFHDDYAISRGLFDPPTTALAILALAALAAGAFALRRRRPLLALGVAWFFAAHALTGTFIPLELVYEHRNYFASLGVCLALADVLLLLPAGEAARRGGIALAGVFGLMFAATTALRANEWNDPLRFASSEAQKHPRSPRATYILAARLVVLSGYRADSPYTPRAREAIAQAIAASGDNVLPEQAALIFATRLGEEPDPRWWSELADGLRRAPHTADNQAALVALGECAIQKQCAFPPERMVATYGAALERRPSAETYTLFGRYALYAIGDTGLALKLWREAVAASPRDPQYRLNLARLLLSLGERAQAREQVAALREFDRRGRFADITRALEAELATPDPPRSPR
jgi:tetratricopeptide (TPR) repeat protein